MFKAFRRKKNQMDKKISLKVRKSDIERVGVIRVNDEILKKIGVEEGERVVISKDEQMILRKAFGDESVKKDEIFLRPKAREKLGVKEGDKVKVEDYETIGEDIKEKLRDAKEKIGKGFGKIKKRFKKEEEED